MATLLIAGTRDIKKAMVPVIENILDQTIIKFDLDISEVIHGGARGVDKYGGTWAKDRKITVKVFEPDWSKGRGAGMERNTIMVEMCDIAIVFWDGHSKGTYDTIKKMMALKDKPFFLNRMAFVQNAYHVKLPEESRIIRPDAKTPRLIH